jgi:hypothetical protein
MLRCIRRAPEAGVLARLLLINKVHAAGAKEQLGAIARFSGDRQGFYGVTGALGRLVGLLSFGSTI